MNFPKVPFSNQDISFHSINVQKPNTKGLQISAWVKDVIGQEKLSLGELHFYFCKDSYLLEINQRYLSHQDYTDIISFQYDDQTLSGDIYISLERIRENAKNFGVSFKEELLRVLIHGVLHFAGYSDKTKKDKEKMRSKENEYILLWKTKYSS